MRNLNTVLFLEWLREFVRVTLLFGRVEFNRFASSQWFVIGKNNSVSLLVSLPFFFLLQKKTSIAPLTRFLLANHHERLF